MAKYQELSHLEAGELALKNFKEAFEREDEAKRKEVVNNFLTNLGSLHQRRDFTAQKERLKRAQQLQRIPGGAKPEEIDAILTNNGMELASMEMQAQMEEQQAQAMKEEYVNRALGVVAQMKPGELGALSYAFPEIGGHMAMFQQMGGGRGGGRGGGHKQFQEVRADGKTLYGSFDPITGAFMKQGEINDPKQGLQMAEIASRISENEMRTRALQRQGDVEGKSYNLGGVHVLTQPWDGKTPIEVIRAAQQGVPGFVKAEIVNGAVQLWYKEPQRGGGGGGGSSRSGAQWEYPWEQQKAIGQSAAELEYLEKERRATWNAMERAKKRGDEPNKKQKFWTTDHSGKMIEQDMAPSQYVQWLERNMARREGELENSDPTYGLWRRRQIAKGVNKPELLSYREFKRYMAQAANNLIGP